jgi:Mrp family chromosome partitioning ATPase
MAMISSISANNPSVDRAIDRSGDSCLDPADEWTSYYAALLRHVQTQQIEVNAPSYAVGITSCSAGAGVTTVAINLAIVAARNGNRRVLLVDANVNNPSIPKFLRLRTNLGFSDAIGSSALLGDCLQSTGVDGLSMLSAGADKKQMGSDYAVSDVVALVDQLKSEFDLIVFDLPQAEELSECYAFAEILDGIYLVLQAGRVDGRVARRVRQRLSHCQANLLGAVYNKQ